MNVNDNINMEYEARVMINEEQYLNIRNHYSSLKIPHKELVNENYYLDTEDLKLTSSHKVLRIRKINNENFELTLKIQEENGCLEINHTISSFEKENIINGEPISYNQIKDKLLELNINPKSIKYITSLKTERDEFTLPNCLLVIDKNYFRGHIDFNIEVESDTEIHAKTQLIEIIKPFGIDTKKDYINKARRAIHNL